MPRLRAFVGHSFTTEDEEVFRKFATFFTNLTKVMPDFSWDHAEEARAMSISEKVQKIASDKNVFVAIYTKKEQVLKAPLPKSWMGRLRLADSDCEWKTSDWIMQETGLAKGMRLDSIFLVEKGVRKPAGLHGDVEYIEFQRDSPETCFGKFMQVVGALSEKKLTDAPSEQDSLTAPPPPEKSENETASESAGVNWTEPEGDWTINTYETALLHSIVAKSGHDQKISDAFLKSDFAKASEAIPAWSAFEQWCRLAFGVGGSVTRLRDLARENPENYQVRFYLARALVDFEKFREAAGEFQAAAEHAPTDSRKARYFGEAADAYRRANLPELSSAALSKARAFASKSTEAELAFLKKQRGLAEETKNTVVLIGTLERWLEIDPADAAVRFTLAYQYGEMGERALSLYHYLLTPYAERTAIAWNNLGAAQNELGMPIKAVRSYLKGKEQGELLSFSNLAFKFLEAGFLDEARTLCEGAPKGSESDKNILAALGRIHESPEEEEKKEEEIKGRARKRGEFYREFGQATTSELVSPLSTHWKGKQFTLAISLSGSAFSGEADYELAAGALAIAIGRSSEAKGERYRLEFHGTVWGRAIVARVSRTRPDANSILQSIDANYDAFIYFDESGRKMHVNETGKEHNRSYSLDAVV